MFHDNGASEVFANVPPEYRPDNDGRPLPSSEQAHVDAVPRGGIRGMGRSPDGLGRHAPRHVPMQGGAMQGAMRGGTPMGYMGPWEPPDVSPEGSVRSAGVTTLLVAVSFGAGVALGGWMGGISGVMLSGAAFNGYRAQKWWGSADPGEKHEAVTSAIMAAVQIAAGGFAGYKSWEDKKGRS